MKRQHFISLLGFAPFLSIQANPQRKNPNAAIVARAGEGRLHGSLHLKGVNENIIDVKISGSDTGGAFALFEQTSLSPGRGTPLHVHPNQDEVFSVLAGSYLFKVGTELFQLSAGDRIFLPRKIPHAWTQLDDTGKMEVLVQPAGKLESFFLAMMAFKGQPNQEELASLFAANEMQVVGGPLPPNRLY